MLFMNDVLIVSSLSARRTRACKSANQAPPLLDRLSETTFRALSSYIKLGQAIGVQAAILPKPYHQLSKLFDNAERLPFKDVERVLISELGQSPEEASTPSLPLYLPSPIMLTFLCCTVLCRIQS